jgi:hypothetical protein
MMADFVSNLVLFELVLLELMLFELMLLMQLVVLPFVLLPFVLFQFTLSESPARHASQHSAEGTPDCRTHNRCSDANKPA